MAAKDTSTSNIPPPIRAEVKMRQITQGGEKVFILKEPDKGSYYQFDEAQYLMLSLFDGKMDVPELVEAFDEASDVYAYDEDALKDLIDSAREFKLLTLTKEEQNTALVEKLRDLREGARLQAQGSLLMMRMSLVDPDEMFDRIINRMRFVWSPAGVKVSFLIIFIAFFMVGLNIDRFMVDLERVMHLATDGVWGLFGIWTVAMCAIAFHEVAHGLTCKHFGGEVHEIGFLLLAFQPCMYCNVNDAWMFESTRHKIYVALAGVWVEMFLGAIAAFIWLIVDATHPLGMICFILMLIATAASLFMNLNPLMKFDGYYILSDLVQVPNLRENAISWFSYLLKVKVFRMDEEAPLRPTRREARVYFIYGGMTVIYLTVMLGGMAIMMHGLVAEALGTWGVIAYLAVVAKFTHMMTGTW
ncbi:MAG: hypothetical protein HQL53_07310, partial [Magnetococcales bacterium]|nr:hypothetical protein [Magnetococcales bacterium]